MIVRKHTGAIYSSVPTKEFECTDGSAKNTGMDTSFCFLHRPFCLTGVMSCNHMRPNLSFVNHARILVCLCLIFLEQAPNFQHLKLAKRWQNLGVYRQDAFSHLWYGRCEKWQIKISEFCMSVFLYQHIFWLQISIHHPCIHTLNVLVLVPTSSV